MEISFTGKRVLVTGASKGIGRELVKRLNKCGALVVAAARSQELLDSLKKEVPGIETVAVDLGNWKETEEVFKSVGNIDLLVNNAGLAILKKLVDFNEEEVDQIFAINVKAVINLTRLAIKQWISRKIPGVIVNISSQAAVAGLIDHTVYCASKGAVDGFTRAVAGEYGPYNIRIANVNPTVIMTDMGKLGWSDPKISGPMLEKIPLRRFGEVEEVVNAVLFLLSDKASMTTGTPLYVDGGYVAI